MAPQTCPIRKLHSDQNRSAQISHIGAPILFPCLWPILASEHLFVALSAYSCIGATFPHLWPALAGSTYRFCSLFPHSGHLAAIPAPFHSLYNSTMYFYSMYLPLQPIKERVSFLRIQRTQCSSSSHYRVCCMCLWPKRIERSM